MSEYLEALSTINNSGIYWIDWVFQKCVVLLVFAAQWLGISYEEINVYLFVFLLPIMLLISLSLNFYLLSGKGIANEKV